jgi:hypothetical protein
MNWQEDESDSSSSTIDLEKLRAIRSIPEELGKVPRIRKER